MRRLVFLLLAATALGASATTSGRAADSDAATHPFSVDDVYALEQVASANALSPNGDLLATVVKAPVVSAPGRAGLFNNDRAEIWLYDHGGGQRRRLVDAVPGEDHWYPTWSPDGERLAFLATSARTGERPQVRIWDRASGRVQALPEAADINNDVSVQTWPRDLFWLSPDEVVYRALPDGADVIMTRSPRPSMNVARAGFAAAERGDQPSALKFDTRGATHPMLSVREDPLVVCRVSTAQCRVLGAVSSAHQFHTDGHAVLLPSPDRDLVAAFAASDRVAPSMGDRRIRWSANNYRLKVFDRGGEVAAAVTAGIRAVAPGSVRWGRDGHELMFLGAQDPRTGVYQGSQANWRLYSLDPGRGVLRTLDLGPAIPIPVPRAPLNPSIDFPDVGLEVLGPQSALVYAPGDEAAGAAWWVVGPAGQRRLPCAERGARLSADGRALFCPAGSTLTRIEVATGATRVVTTQPGVRLRMAPTYGEDEGGRLGARAVLTAIAPDGATRYRWLDLASGALRDLAVPDRDTLLATYNPGVGAAVFVHEGDDGTRVLLAREATQEPAVAYSANAERLAQVRGGRRIAFDYHLTDGTPMKGWALLPPDYQPGR
ncbi:MAG: PD40 domain-containing protein, partial [Proteobacteria bacterium]|nr:PD40 domain-containing protein [Pseudomonadota bacterium]